MTITAQRHTGAHATHGPHPAPEYAPSGSAAQAPAEGKDTLRTCRACPAHLGQGNKSGLCRACWLDPAKRVPRPEAQTAKQRYDRQPSQQIKAATRMLLRALAAAAEEDPGEGLALALEAEPRIRAALNACGIAAVAAAQEAGVGGATHVAAELTANTSQTWSRQRVDERWGEKAAARNAWRKDGAEAEAAQWARRNRNDR